MAVAHKSHLSCGGSSVDSAGGCARVHGHVRSSEHQAPGNREGVADDEQDEQPRDRHLDGIHHKPSLTIHPLEMYVACGFRMGDPLMRLTTLAGEVSSQGRFLSASLIRQQP